ncbi:MAG TPA: TspO/MBR family protein [Candidatus Paceibacterota bacterium]|nr:TspO/MBR family protein [Candidatus Paceibacterota bacterium]
MNTQLFKRIVGVFLIVIGVIALLTPFTPGSWLAIIGLELLGFELVYTKRFAAFLERFHEERPWLLASIAFVAPFVAGAVGAHFTTSQIPSWYVGLVKPSWTPPAFVFGPAWTTLYLLMGIAAVLIARKQLKEVVRPLGIYFTQLVLNAGWPLTFFGMHAPVLALGVIFALWSLILWLIIEARRLSRPAAWLLAPYLLWVTYAASLNLGVVWLN